ECGHRAPRGPRPPGPGSGGGPALPGGRPAKIRSPGPRPRGGGIRPATLGATDSADNAEVGSVVEVQRDRHTAVTRDRTGGHGPAWPDRETRGQVRATAWLAGRMCGDDHHPLAGWKIAHCKVLTPICVS